MNMTPVAHENPSTQPLKGAIMIAAIVVIVGGISAWAIMTYINTRQETEKIERELEEETVPIIGIFDVKNKLDKNEPFRLIDVRAQEDYETMHIPTSENIPIDTFRTGAYTQLPIDVDIIILDYGTGCDFSEEAGELLREKEYDRVWRMTAGIDGWVQANLPLVEASDTENPTNMYKIASIEPTELRKLLNNANERANVAIVDVRPENEFREGRLEGSIHINTQHLERETAMIPRDKRLVIVSSTGTEGEKVGATLFDLNYFSILNLEGGWKSWNETENVPNEEIQE